MSGVYCCPYCLKAQGTPELLDELPADYLCTCFPLHGQWMPVMINGECVGTVLLDSSHIEQTENQDGS